MQGYRIACLCSLNSVAGSKCTIAKTKALSDQLKNQLNVQVLVVAINGINGGPEDFYYLSLTSIATVRYEENAFRDNTYFQWAPDSQSVSTPLIWDLSNGLTLNNVHNALTSRMGCCDCVFRIELQGNVSKQSMRRLCRRQCRC